MRCARDASIRNATTGAGSPELLRTAYAALEGPLFHGGGRQSDDARGGDSRLPRGTRKDGAASFVRAEGRVKGVGQECTTYRGEVEIPSPKPMGTRFIWKVVSRLLRRRERGAARSLP